MSTRSFAQICGALMLATLAACAAPNPTPTSVQNGRVTPSPGSAYNPISGTSAQD